MTRRYEHLRFNFPKESKELAKKCGLSEFFKTEDGKNIISEFHSIVKSADGSNDETFVRAIYLALEQVQYRLLNYFSIDGLAPEQRNRYRQLNEYLLKLTNSHEKGLETEQATEIVMLSILQELKSADLTIN